MPHNFIILFDGKEGTSPVVRMLDNFSGISIVRQANNRGWEPFDRHNCGHISTTNLAQCLTLLFEQRNFDLDENNAIYMQTAKRPLAFDVSSQAIGFKHRFNHPQKYPFGKVSHKKIDGAFCHLFGPMQNKRYSNLMFDLFVKHNIVVFMAIRQDVLRWALSYYRGNGFGDSSNNLQFKVANGKIKPHELPPMKVEIPKLRKLVRWCDKRLEAKQRLANQLTKYGIPVYPLFYEQFLSNKLAYFTNFLNHIEYTELAGELMHIIERDTKLQKVTPTDISQFTINSEEILSEFGGRQFIWVA